MNKTFDNFFFKNFSFLPFLRSTVPPQTFNIPPQFGLFCIPPLMGYFGEVLFLILKKEGGIYVSCYVIQEAYIKPY